MISQFGDIRDSLVLASELQDQAPEIVFHMAAQPLVRRSYEEPAETFATNVMGTVHLLEAVRQAPSVRVVIVVTSDKCYENRGGDSPYRESDPMGGYDPYSASKGAAELVTASYRNSFFHPARFQDHGVSVASVRAGNVIGGGDWSEDRLVPDCIKALVTGKPIPVRNPRAVRPWQYILEPLAGYLWLAVRMWEEPEVYAGAWNFGPDTNGRTNVSKIVTLVIQQWGQGNWEDVSAQHRDRAHEATTLQLDCTKATAQLGWRSILSVREAVVGAVEWYRGCYFDSHFDGRAFTLRQIEAYVDLARSRGLPWAISNMQSNGTTPVAR
jgi:CDP-glucose 4,6-dehydratase